MFYFQCTCVCCSVCGRYRSYGCDILHICRCLPLLSWPQQTKSLCTCTPSNTPCSQHVYSLILSSHLLLVGTNRLIVPNIFRLILNTNNLCISLFLCFLIPSSDILISHNFTSLQIVDTICTCLPNNYSAILFYFLILQVS